jgi:hypothetical protein
MIYVIFVTLQFIDICTRNLKHNIMKKHFLFFLCCWVLSLPKTLNAQSQIHPDDKLSLGGYIRSSAYGAGERFDYANAFVEGQFSADIVKGFTEGYGFFKADIRLRDGQFFGVNQTQLEIKDLYAGYRNEKFEFTLGNQSIQWGRGIGANPTNNLTPTNGFFLSANSTDQRLSNFMVRAKYSIHPNLEWEVVGVPIYKPSTVRADLLNLPPGTIAGSEFLPEQKYKNGSVATRLNLNIGALGGSVSYYNGYNPNEAIIPSAGSISNTQSFRKQTFGADFGIKLTGHTDGSNDATDDLLIMSEIGYDKTANPTNEAWIPQSNLSYTLGMIKVFNDKYKLDKLTIIVSYVGKYTPDFITAIKPTNYADPNFGTNIINYYRRLITQKIFGQQNELIHSSMCSVSKTFDKGKYSLSVTGLYNFTVKSSMFTPRVSWNITKSLSTTVGGFYLFGPGTEVVSPTKNGLFCELKHTF